MKSYFFFYIKKKGSEGNDIVFIRVYCIFIGYMLYKKFHLYTDDRCQDTVYVSHDHIIILQKMYISAIVILKQRITLGNPQERQQKRKTIQMSKLSWIKNEYTWFRFWQQKKKIL